MELWQIEQIRDKVEELEDEMNVRIYDPSGTVYKIWYNPADRVALYARVLWNSQQNKESLTKAWPQQILRAINTKGAKVRVEKRDSGRFVEWFDSTQDPNAMIKAYEYIISFRKR